MIYLLIINVKYFGKRSSFIFIQILRLRYLAAPSSQIVAQTQMHSTNLCLDLSLCACLTIGSHFNAELPHAKRESNRVVIISEWQIQLWRFW